MKLIWPLIAILGMMVLAVPALDGLNSIAQRRSGLSSEPPAEPEPQATVGAGVSDDDGTPTVEVSGQLYRWRDADGTLHIESLPPPPGTLYETIEYRRTDQASIEDNVEITPPRRDRPGPRSLTRTPLGVYTPDGMRELMERIDDTARRLDERDSLMEELGEQL